MIEVRPLVRHAEFQEAVKLQQRIWGFEEIELLPVRLFVVATKVGGHAFGAFEGRSMVGFCLAIPGLKAGSSEGYLHSHMLGVLPEYRNAGVGRALKLAQREEALGRGIRLIEWTFDPLELKNAYFNIERLGAVVRRYALNQYGLSSSHLQGALPTDRCIAEWWIASPRAEALIAGRPFPRPPVEARIEAPADIGVLRHRDPERAIAIQHAMSEAFQDCFRRGLAVTGFERSEAVAAYLLSNWDERVLTS